MLDGREFGSAIAVDAGTWEFFPEDMEKLVTEVLLSHYSETKEKEFPDWESPAQIIHGPVTFLDILTRIDGKRVDFDTLRKYLSVRIRNEEWDMGEDYIYENRPAKAFGWYAVVPEEYLEEN